MQNAYIYICTDARNCGCVYNNEVDDYYVGSANMEIISTHGSFQPNSECAWFIKAPSGHHVSLTFSSITLEDTFRCHRESVKVTYFIVFSLFVLNKFRAVRSFESTKYIRET